MADARDKECWDKHRDLIRPYKSCSVENGRLIDCPDDASVYFDSIQRVVDFLGTLPPKLRVLDVGCGVGLFAPLFVDFEYTGVDQNEPMLETAQTRFPNNKFVLGNAIGLSTVFAPFSFDLVFTRAVVQHNIGLDKDAFIRQLHSVLVPNGLYLAVEDQFLIENSTRKDIDDYMVSFGWSLERFFSPNYFVFRKRPLEQML